MLILFLFLIIFNLFILYNFKKFTKIIGLYDFPNKKLKIHKEKISLTGGTIIILNILIIVILDFFFKNGFSDFFLHKKELIIFLFILFLFFILGFFDDKYDINPNIKFFLSILISLIFVTLDQNLLIQNFSLSFYENRIFLENYSLLFTIFCIIVLINALNFYDGINAQSLVFFVFAFLYLLIISSRVEFYIPILIILSFLLILNLKNKLFLGDNGIYILVIILSVALIYEHNIHGNIFYVDEIFFLLLLPGLDLLRLTISRLYMKKNPFYGDRNHIHHLLIKKYSLLPTNLILITLAIMPIIFFDIFKLNFYITLLFFLLIYFLLIFKNIKND
tara:strand:- start:1564 stop:2565 length:1002 start_codon:yes stop_codon:yes gene_type:complete